MEPSYPAPADLTSQQNLVAAGFENLTSSLDGYLKHSKWKTLSQPLADIPNATFSLGLFSINDPAATKLQYHYTSPEIAKAPNGTHRVYADTIYRVASVTKVLTVLTGLLELSSSDWDRPITDILPPLARFTREKKGENDPIFGMQWDKVNLKALAASVAGVPRDGFPNTNDLAFDVSLRALTGQPPKLNPTTLGLPPISQNNPFLTRPAS